MIDLGKSAIEQIASAHEIPGAKQFSGAERAEADKTTEKAINEIFGKITETDIRNNLPNEKPESFASNIVEQLGKHPELHEDGMYTTYKERLDHTPTENSNRGHWSGERGESVFIPKYEYVKEELKKFNIEGIPYKNAVVDFSKCSLQTLEIENMTDQRLGSGKNYEQFDTKLAERWNAENREGRNNWTHRDVEYWREENKLTVHERNDMKTCDLVPTKIHEYFNHSGGVAECNKRDCKNGGVFDD